MASKGSGGGLFRIAKSGVFYIVYVRSFKDTTGDGVGDLAGLAEQLDYLSDTLGVDAILGRS